MAEASESESSSTARSYVVIPARAASTRLPGKLLLRDTGRSVLEHTYRAAAQARRPSGICVAAADEQIAAEVRRFGGECRLTDPAAPSGTDRVAEVARTLPEVDVFVNVQGDEPEIDPGQIDQLIDLLQSRPAAAMATLATPIRDRRRLQDPACVKVVCDGQGRALYFSRSVIPHPRQWSDEWLEGPEPRFFQHLGIYAYRREFLLAFTSLPPSRLEAVECLEQLRVLEAGHTILVGITARATQGIDTAEDYEAFVRRTRNC